MYFGAKPMTTFASICMVVLREIRIANGYSLEALSDRLNIKSQEWHSMETGGRDLQFETFVRACHQLNTKPAQVICLSERYAEILAALGWDILYNRITKGNDNLLESAKGYWASPGVAVASETCRYGKILHLFSTGLRWLPRFPLCFVPLVQRFTGQSSNLTA
jgi:transcriptional regulator with XRE-family HTH domain